MPPRDLRQQFLPHLRQHVEYRHAVRVFLVYVDVPWETGVEEPEVRCWGVGGELGKVDVVVGTVEVQEVEGVFGEWVLPEVEEDWRVLGGVH